MIQPMPLAQRKESSFARIKTFIRGLVPPSVYDNLALRFQSFRMYFRDFGANPPILIYQIGKVGSTTVQRSLEGAKLPNPIYHVHHLSDIGIRAAEEYYLGLQVRIPREIGFSRMLHRQIEKYKATAHYRIITLVREPIGRQISDFFQNVETYWPHLIDASGRVKVDDAIEHLYRTFMSYEESTDYASTWFERELKPMFEIDVYSYPFSHDSGFTIVRERNADVLILRLEDLDRNFGHAVGKFLDLCRPIQLLKDNVAEEKMHAEEYACVLKNMVLPESVCARIYSSKYARHFYTESTRNEFVRKWSRDHDRRGGSALRSVSWSIEDSGYISGRPSTSESGLGMNRGKTSC